MHYNLVPFESQIITSSFEWESEGVVVGVATDADLDTVDDVFGVVIGVATDADTADDVFILVEAATTGLQYNILYVNYP